MHLLLGWHSAAGRADVLHAGPLPEPPGTSAASQQVRWTPALLQTAAKLQAVQLKGRLQAGAGDWQGLAPHQGDMYRFVAPHRSQSPPPRPPTSFSMTRCWTRAVVSMLSSIPFCHSAFWASRRGPGGGEDRHKISQDSNTL